MVKLYRCVMWWRSDQRVIIKLSTMYKITGQRLISVRDLYIPERKAISPSYSSGEIALRSGLYEIPGQDFSFVLWYALCEQCTKWRCFLFRLYYGGRPTLSQRWFIVLMSSIPLSCTLQPDYYNCTFYPRVRLCVIALLLVSIGRQ